MTRNPLFSLTENLGTIAPSATDPVAYNFALLPDKIIVYQPDRNHVGYHLGALSRANPPQWLWKTCLNGPLNGKGNFDSFCEYAAEEFKLVGNNIFFAFRGEYWQGKGQANQVFQYSTSGQFIKQFGMPVKRDQGEVLHPAGAAQNMFTLNGTQNGTSMFIYVNDEGGRGVHRWKIDP